MWLVHEASTPEAVALRGGLSGRIFELWRREHPELAARLHGGPLPAETEDSPFSAGMRRFNVQTQVVKIAEAARRPLEGPWSGSRERSKGHVTTAMIHHWLRQFAEQHHDERQQRLFRRWLLCGEMPEGIRVITTEEFYRGASAWDYIRLGMAAEIHLPQVAYEGWLREPLPVLPNGPARLPWLLWLYKSPGPWHAPSFVVTPDLQKYRQFGSVKTIAKAVGLSRAVKRWKKNPGRWRLVKEAIEAARLGKPAADSEEFRRLDPGTRERITRYAKAATKVARCKAAGICTVDFDKRLREAEQRGVRDALVDYLESRGVYRDTKYRRQKGLIVGNLFVAPPALWDFHNRAVKEWKRQKLGELEHLPGFHEWFATWVTPAVGKRPGGVQARQTTREVLGRESPPACPNSDQANILVEAAEPSPAQPVPRWDASARRFWLGDQLLKAFDRQRAKSQTDLLTAFETAAWASSIPNPFGFQRSDGVRMLDKEKLWQTCKSLNRTLPSRTIRFHRDGTGERVQWSLVAAPTAQAHP
jgi:hypothetical protein